MLPLEAIFRVHKTDSHLSGRKITCVSRSLGGAHSRPSMHSLQPKGGGSRAAQLYQAPQRVRRRAGMELWWIAVLALASGGYCASLGNRREESSIVEAVNTYNGDRNTSSVSGLLDVGTKGNQTEKNCSTLISGDTANSTVIHCNPTKPLFVNSERQKQWRENVAEQREETDFENPSGLRKNLLYLSSGMQKQSGEKKARERRGRRTKKPSGARIDSTDTLANNSISDTAHVACVSCVLCSLTNSCAR
ncbi:uncharacterized protein LOC144783764 [Lissotriton helveticus]